MRALSPTPPGRRRGVALAVLVAAALGVHVAVLGGASWPASRHAASPLPQAMQVRTVEPPSAAEPGADAADVAVAELEVPAPVVAVPASLRPLPVSLKTPPPRARPAIAPAPARVEAVQVPRAAEPESAAIADVAPADAPADVAAPALSAPVAQVATATPSSPAAEPEAPPPVYRTEMPPPATMRYLLQRGLLRGDGELQWRPGDGRYEIRLEGRVAGLAILTQVSTGGFDAAGLAPLRYTDQRPRRGIQAANFQRDAGKITFSGPSTEFPLVPGTQDRVSWMIQLAAAVAADPQRAAPGARTEFEVSGARADVDTWTFRCLGAEPIAAGGATVPALHFIREPRSAYDTRVDVWLDPRQHFLPVRAVLRSGEGEPLELVLRELTVGS